ncbi:hypothetical protein Dda_2713 [Drechslerella dactyloides]|uniref:Very-long-chain (3R)-3-hydroxyacyl-CoA dehydratase n=1 Tax=Drechslerella dactyloides TaxID=74499 RepID=A0AAD6J004_DREDA|nr:hypothetical protein Dda_2713 [Drechslerella dactyloides]
MASRLPASQRRSLTLKANYLVAYNTLSAALWAVVLARVVATSARDGVENVYENVGNYVKWTQTLALMEIVHAIVGVVRTPLFTTLTQVASRFNLVWPVLGFTATPMRSSPAYAAMLLAWSVTEIIRYSYYAANLQGEPPAWLSALRYNTFFVLYPVGIVTEMWEIYGAMGDLEAFGGAGSSVGWWLAALEKVVLYATYVPGSYVMYTHMMRQRRKMIRGKKVVRN